MTPTDIRIMDAIRRPLGGRAFKQPLIIGDTEQIRILRAMNGDRPYCDRCFHVLEDGHISDCSLPCQDCYEGIYVPPPSMEAPWLNYIEVDCA